MTHVATFVSTPASQALSNELLRWLARHLPSAEEPQWLEFLVAADIPFTPSRDCLLDYAALHESIAGLPIDVIVQPRATRRKKLLVADMDSTMIGQECIDELADYANLKDEVAAITERAMQGELDFAGALEARVALLRGLEASAIAECLRTRIRPNPGAKTLVATMKNEGALTVLVSGGFVDFVRPVARELGFDRIKANELGFEDGRLNGKTVGPIVDSTVKRRVAEDILKAGRLGPETLVAIGDGANDVPLIKLAGLGVGYRPKPALAEIAAGIIRHHELTALLWMQGIPRRRWVT
jgi:phosphoserine phosphatase